MYFPDNGIQDNDSEILAEILVSFASFKILN